MFQAISASTRDRDFRKSRGNLFSVVDVFRSVLLLSIIPGNTDTSWMPTHIGIVWCKRDGGLMKNSGKGWRSCFLVPKVSFNAIFVFYILIPLFRIDMKDLWELGKIGRCKLLLGIFLKVTKESNLVCF